MKWKDIYNKCNNKLYCQITDITGTPTLHSNFKVFLKNNKLKMLFIGIIFLVLLFYTYKLNFATIGVALIIALILIFGLIYNNTYTIEAKKDKLNCNVDFNKMTINYSDLINIYLSRENSKILMFFPIYKYSLNIIFVKEENQVCMTLSTIMLNKNELVKFFDKFKFEVLPEQEQEEKRISDDKQTKKAIYITTSIVFIVIFVVLMVIFAINGISVLN